MPDLAKNPESTPDDLITNRALVVEAMGGQFYAMLERGDTKGALTVLRNQWGMFGGRPLDDPEHPATSEKIEELWLPRIGCRRFSLNGLPDSRPFHKWRWVDHLPWQVMIRPEHVRPLREALGCDNGTPDEELALGRFLDDLANGRLLLRVMPLARDQAITPSDCPRKRKARLDHWLPIGWGYDPAEEHGVEYLRWNRPTRFASPETRKQLPAGRCVLWWGEVTHVEVTEAMRLTGALARWLGDGSIWVFVKPEQEKSSGETPASRV